MSGTADTPAIEALLSRLALLEAKVSLLDAKDEIVDLITTYARACDVGNDPVLLRPLFTDDADWNCDGFGTFHGGDECALGLKAVAGEKIWWSLHNMISPQIEVAENGTDATGFCYLWEAATVPNVHSGEAEAHWIGATYDFRFRKENGRWLFSYVNLKCNMVSPFSEGWVKKRWPDGTSKQPSFLNLEAGKTYHWCKCGKAENGPLVDPETHMCGKSPPTPFTVDRNGWHPVCNCRYSKKKPLCDGSHLNLKYDYSLLPARMCGAKGECA